MTSPPKRDGAADRRARVLQLRAAGLTYQAIADQLGYRSAGAAAQDAKRALAARQALLDGQGPLSGTLELERLDALERAAQTVLQTAARAGDHETVLRSVDRLVRVSERRARLLATETVPPAETARGRRPGPVERKVRADISALVSGHPMGEALTEMSFTLARTLDQGAGLATAAVNRELRANLTELARLAANDDDDLADELSAAVRHTKNA